MAWQRCVNHTAVCSLSSPGAQTCILRGSRGPDFSQGVEKSRHVQGHYSARTTPGCIEPGSSLAQRHASEFGVLAAEAAAAGPAGSRGLGASTWRPAAGPGQGQREPLGRGERACQGGGLVQGFTCGKINAGQSVPLCSAVVKGGGQHFQRAGGCFGGKSSS